MKANKFFAASLAALALVGFASCGGNGDDPQDPKDPQKEDVLALDNASFKLKVDEEATLTATIEVEFTADKEGVVTLTPNADKKSVVIKAVAEGNAIITAKSAGGQVKNCVVAVSAKGQGGTATVKGTQIWPIILDGVTYEANASKVVASFQPNDVDQFLYVWEGTYDANNNPSGMNFYGNTEGFTALTVAAKGWAGMGYCLTEKGTGWEPAEALRAAIVANPDDYYLHMAIKSTDNYSHCFYFMGNEGTKFGIGSTMQYSAPDCVDFTRDGKWAEFDIPMSKYAVALAASPVTAGVNVFVALSEGVQGAQLNLDAVYFYKK